MNYNGTEYYYMLNGQNDIVGLMDNSGAVMVSYSYDSWGKSLTVSGTLATTLGQDNPFRYRGYHYDTETGLYYLQTRYYDATVCRFISADTYFTTSQGIIGSNMYAYCNNDPAAFIDSNGTEAVPVQQISGLIAGIQAALAAIGTAIGASTGTIVIVAAVVVVVAAVVTTVKAVEDERAKPQHTVYLLRDPITEEVEYVGRTKNYEKRMAVHASGPRGNLIPKVAASGLNYYEARVLEQNLMVKYHTINTAKRISNQINGISPKKPFGKAYAELAKGVKNYLSNRISSRVLSMLEF